MNVAMRVEALKHVVREMMTRGTQTTTSVSLSRDHGYFKKKGAQVMAIEFCAGARPYVYDRSVCRSMPRNELRWTRGARRAISATRTSMLLLGEDGGYVVSYSSSNNKDRTSFRQDAMTASRTTTGAAT